MNKNKIQVGDTLNLSDKLRKKSKYTYNIFNGKQITRIFTISTLAEAKKISEEFGKYFILNGSFKVIGIQGMFGEDFMPYENLIKYVE